MLEKQVPRLVPAASEEGTNVYSGKVPLYPVSSNPKKTVQRKVKAFFPVSPRTLIFIPSPLLFYGIAELLENTDTSVHIICVETIQSFMRFSIDNVDPSLYSHKRITFVRTDSAEQILVVLRQLGVEQFKRVLPMYLSRGYAFSRNTYDSMVDTLSKEIRSYWENKMTSIHMGNRWLKNLLLNLSSFSYSKDLSSLVAEKPVLVTGAGISLEKTLEDLCNFRIRDQFYIIATDTSLPTLLSYSVYPDSVCILESQMYNIRDFIGSIPLKCSVLCDITAHPQSFFINKGPMYLFSSTFSHNSLFKRMSSKGILPKQIPPLGSVGIAALEIAASITTYPVYYTGLDFSYLPGKTHARGTEIHKHTLAAWNRLRANSMYPSSILPRSFALKDNFGNPCRSNIVLQSYAETAKERLKGKNHCYNLASFGLSTGGESISIDMVKTAKEIVINRSTESSRGKSKEIHFSPSTDKLISFLREEKEALSLFVDSGRAYLQGSKRPRLYEDLITHLRRVDFILIPFPDQEIKTEPDITFVKRTLASALVFLSYVNTAMQRVCSTLRSS